MIINYKYNNILREKKRKRFGQFVNKVYNNNEINNVSCFQSVHKKAWRAFRPLRSLYGTFVNARAKGQLDKAVNLKDMRIAAEKRAHHMVFEYIDGGADDDQITLQRSMDRMLRRP